MTNNENNQRIKNYNNLLNIIKSDEFIKKFASADYDAYKTKLYMWDRDIIFDLITGEIETEDRASNTTTSYIDRYIVIKTLDSLSNEFPTPTTLDIAGFYETDPETGEEIDLDDREDKFWHWYKDNIDQYFEDWCKDNYNEFQKYIIDTEEQIKEFYQKFYNEND